ncbi:hypothetical protein STBA_11300 [Streptomyces sp. MP131-18]|nr:hypothetical protein STBA_11300 [Streptomyces sp. MP131-18]
MQDGERDRADIAIEWLHDNADAATRIQLSNEPVTDVDYKRILHILFGPQEVQ